MIYGRDYPVIFRQDTNYRGYVVRLHLKANILYNRPKNLYIVHWIYNGREKINKKAIVELKDLKFLGFKIKEL